MELKQNIKVKTGKENYTETKQKTRKTKTESKNKALALQNPF